MAQIKSQSTGIAGSSAAKSYPSRGQCGTKVPQEISKTSSNKLSEIAERVSTGQGYLAWPVGEAVLGWESSYHCELG